LVVSFLLLIPPFSLPFLEQRLIPSTNEFDLAMAPLPLYAFTPSLLSITRRPLNDSDLSFLIIEEIPVLIVSESYLLALKIFPGDPHFLPQSSFKKVSGVARLRFPG